MAEDTRYQSESHADSAIASALIRAGLTQEEALTVLLESVRGEAARERKGERYWVRYWQRTVVHAASFVGDVVERHDGQRYRRLPDLKRPQVAYLPSLQRPLEVCRG
jgi:hypothetical protein